MKNSIVDGWFNNEPRRLSEIGIQRSECRKYIELHASEKFQMPTQYILISVRTYTYWSISKQIEASNHFIIQQQ